MTAALKAEATRALIAACGELSWRDAPTAMRNILTNLSWWLDEEGAHIEAVTVAGKINEEDTKAYEMQILEAILKETDIYDVEDLRNYTLNTTKRVEELDAFLDAQGYIDLTELKEDLDRLRKLEG